MLFQRKGTLPAPMNRTMRNPLLFNNRQSVLYDQNLMVSAIPEWVEMRAHLFVRERGQDFLITVMRRADEQGPPGRRSCVTNVAD